MDISELIPNDGKYHHVAYHHIAANEEHSEEHFLRVDGVSVPSGKLSKQELAMLFRITEEEIAVDETHSFVVADYVPPFDGKIGAVWVNGERRK